MAIELDDGSLLMETAVVRHTQGAMHVALDRGVTTERLPWIRSALEEWANMQLAYFDNSQGKDALWWYGERALVGLLSTALWRTGAQSIEEFATEYLKPKKGGRHLGRQDLYAKVGNIRVIAEAKFGSTRLASNVSSAVSHVKDLRSEAYRQVRMKKAYGAMRLSVVFYAPTHDLDYNLVPGEVRRRLRDFTRQVTMLRPRALAWLFPEAARNWVPTQEGSTLWGDDKRPGGIIVMDVVPSPRRDA